MSTLMDITNTIIYIHVVSKKAILYFTYVYLKCFKSVAFVYVSVWQGSAVTHIRWDKNYNGCIQRSVETWQLTNVENRSTLFLVIIYNQVSLRHKATAQHLSFSYHLWPLNTHFGHKFKNNRAVSCQSDRLYICNASPVIKFHQGMFWSKYLI